MIRSSQLKPHCHPGISGWAKATCALVDPGWDDDAEWLYAHFEKHGAIGGELTAVEPRFINSIHMHGPPPAWYTHEHAERLERYRTAKLQLRRHLPPTLQDIEQAAYENAERDRQLAREHIAAQEWEAEEERIARFRARAEAVEIDRQEQLRQQLVERQQQRYRDEIARIQQEGDERRAQLRLTLESLRRARAPFEFRPGVHSWNDCPNCQARTQFWENTCTRCKVAQ
jgi:hypothetical protein